MVKASILRITEALEKNLGAGTVILNRRLQDGLIPENQLSNVWCSSGLCVNVPSKDLDCTVQTLTYGQ